MFDLRKMHRINAITFYAIILNIWIIIPLMINSETPTNTKHNDIDGMNVTQLKSIFANETIIYFHLSIPIGDFQNCNH